MIVTDLDHLAEQTVMTPLIQKAVDFIKKAQAQPPADGRIAIEGDTVYALVQSYDTMPATAAAKFEGHRKYIDLQYVLEGEEAMGWAALDAVKVTAPYDAQKDVWLGTAKRGRATYVKAVSGQLAVFYPSDAHAPRLTTGKPGRVRKIVVKIAVG